MTTPTPAARGALAEDPAIVLQREYAFYALAQSIRALTPRLGAPVSDDIEAAREATEAQALTLLERIAPDTAILISCLSTPSLPLLRSLFQGGLADAWRALLDEQLRVWEDYDNRPSHLLPYDKAAIGHLLYLEEVGLPLKLWRHDLCKRYLVEEDARIDPIVGGAIGTSREYLLSAVVISVSHPLADISDTRGYRHLESLEILVRVGEDRKLITHLQGYAQEMLRTGFGSWRALALLLRLGLDLSHLQGRKITPRLRELLDLSASAHGQMEILRREPSLREMAARCASTGAYFGAAARAFIA